MVDLQHVLHRTDELGVGLRRDAPLLLQPRLEFVFFSVRRTVSSETRVHDLQLDQLVGQQPQRPADSALRRLGAGQGDQAGFGLAIELPLPAGPVLLLAAQGGLQALLDEALADAFDGA